MFPLADRKMDDFRFVKIVQGSGVGATFCAAGGGLVRLSFFGQKWLKLVIFMVIKARPLVVLVKNVKNGLIWLQRWILGIHMTRWVLFFDHFFVIFVGRMAQGLAYRSIIFGQFWSIFWPMQWNLQKMKFFAISLHWSKIGHFWSSFFGDKKGWGSGVCDKSRTPETRSLFWAKNWSFWSFLGSREPREL